MHKVIGPRILSKRTQNMELYGPTILSEGQLTHRSSVKEVSLVLAELQSKTKKNSKKQQQEVTLIGEQSKPHIVQSRFRVIYI